MDHVTMFSSSFVYLLLAIVIKVRRLFVSVCKKIKSICLQPTNIKHSYKHHLPLEYVQPTCKPYKAPHAIFILLKH